MHKSRQSFIATILVLYFVPLFVMGSYSLRWLTLAQSRNLISLGVLLAICGSLAIYIYLYRWEREKPKEVAISPEAPTFEPEYHELQRHFDQQTEELRTMQDEMERYRKLWEDLDNERTVFKESLEEQLVEKNRLLLEYEETNASLKQDLEKVLQKNEELEIKVNDLNYEIKTLLQLSELDESLKEEEPFEALDPSPVYKTPEVEPAQPVKMIRNPEEASMQLKRCLDIAQKITGASHYQHLEGRYQNFPTNNAALDLRHLFDNLRSEHGASILFYSHKDHKLLFANNQIKNLLGWSPEKVIQDFSELIVEGGEDWKEAIRQSKNQGPLSLMMKTKSGEILEIKALIGIIPSGVFRQDLITVLYPK